MADTCPATNRHGEPCGLSAGWGTENDTGPCKYHGGASTGAPKDNDNAVTHGAFREHFRADLTPGEQAALDDLVGHLRDISDERTIAAEAAAEALLKYKRSADSRFLREARQWFAEFNLIPNEDVMEHTGPDGTPLFELPKAVTDEWVSHGGD